MTGRCGLSTGHVCGLGGWTGPTSFGWTLGYHCLATLRSPSVADTLRQDTACRQVSVYLGMR